jgi:beta-lactamase regulating signal transducer with metallopeptidase domain
MFDLAKATAWSLRSLQTAAPKGAARATIAAAAILIGIGLVRFLWAVNFTLRLYRQSEPLADERVASLADQLATSLGVARRFELRQSALLMSPAVIGFRRPAILLPIAHDTWSVDELRAVLAHELAHVLRGDALTRLVASCATALHFYHPLVHWLSARLTLSQELAADRLAAVAVGGRETYLRSISQLAIWLDEQPRLRAEPLVLPALSSNLIRRITMLRSMDCRLGGERPGRAATVAAMFLALAVLITTALRGNAEDATIAASKSLATPSPSTSGDVFNRPPLDFSIIGDNGSGAFVVRVSELMQQPAIRALVESEVGSQQTINGCWTQAFGSDVQPPDVCFDSIDYIAGIGTYVVRPLKPDQAPSGMSQQVMLGSAQTVVRFKEPVAWREWIHDHIPGAVEKSSGGISYLELPVIKVLGPQPMRVAERDPQTIVVAFTDDIATAAAPGPRPALSALATRWAELDGGLATFISTDHDVDHSEPGTTDPKKVLAKKIFAASRLLGVGFDVDPQTHRAFYRVQLTCDNAAAAHDLQSTFESLLALAKVKLPTELAESQAADKSNPEAAKLDAQRFETASELVANCRVSVWQKPDGAAGILVETSSALPDEAVASVAAAPEKTAENAVAPK